MKLEVGMYVRTLDGIMRVIEVKVDRAMTRFVNEDGNIYFINDLMTNPSRNIMELFEVGDYVNGKKVIKKWEEPTGEFVGQTFIQLEGEETIPTIRKIETIVTKEQFESITYKVK